jgi:hypothetical protein
MEPKAPSVMAVKSASAVFQTRVFREVRVRVFKDFS